MNIMQLKLIALSANFYSICGDTWVVNSKSKFTQNNWNWCLLL
jgi:hypothetical protein